MSLNAMPKNWAWKFFQQYLRIEFVSAVRSRFLSELMRTTAADREIAAGDPNKSPRRTANFQVATIPHTAQRFEGCPVVLRQLR